MPPILLGLLCLAGPLRAETEAVCRDYARAAVEAVAESRDRGCDWLAGPRWQADEASHYGWCLGAPSEWVQAEAQARSNEMRVCRREPLALACDATATEVEAGDRGLHAWQCGGPEPASRDAYLADCLADPELAILAGFGTYLALRACVGERGAACHEHATRAAVQAREAERLGCAFRGPVWTATYEETFLACLGQPTEAVRAQEAERDGDLLRCRAIGPPP